jgi:hypothetical protein
MVTIKYLLVCIAGKKPGPTYGLPFHCQCLSTVAFAKASVGNGMESHGMNVPIPEQKIASKQNKNKNNKVLTT